MSMSEKSLRVKYLADVSQLVKGLRTAGDSQKSFGDRVKALRPALIGLGSTLLLTGGYLAKLGQEHQRADVMIRTAVENAGGAWDKYKPKIEAAVEEQEKFGHGAGDTKEALSRLTIALGSPDKALKGLSAAADLAALKHISLKDASVQLAKAAGGSNRALKELGINTANLAPPTDAAQKAFDKAKTKVNELADKEMKTAGAKHAYQVAVEKMKAAQDTLNRSHDRWGQILDAIKPKIHGLAENESKTLQGRLEAIKTHVTDVAASFGQKYGPALLGAGTVMTTLGPVLGGLGGALKGLFGVAMSGFKALFAVFEANPWMLAIAGLILVVTLIVTHWKQVKAFLLAAWHAIKDAAAVIWGAIHKALVVVWTAIKVAVMAYFNIYKTVILAVWNAIHVATSAVWNAIKVVLSTVFNAVKAVVTTYFNVYKTVVLAVWHAIQSVTSTVWNAIRSVISTVMGTIRTVITGAINGARDVWNSVLGTMKRVASDVVDAVLGFFYHLRDEIMSIVHAIGGFFDKLAFWRHSPSQLEVNAELSTNNAVASFQRMKQKMETTLGGVRAPLFDGPIVPRTGTTAGAASSLALVATGSDARVVALLTELLAAVRAHRKVVVEVDGKTLFTAVEKERAYASRGRG